MEVVILILALVAAVAAVMALMACLAARRDAAATQQKVDALASGLQALPGSDEGLRQFISSELAHSRESTNASLSQLSTKQAELTNQLMTMQRTVGTLQTQVVRELGASREQQQASFIQMQQGLSGSVQDMQASVSKNLAQVQQGLTSSVNGLRDGLSKDLAQMRTDNATSLDAIRTESTSNLERIRRENTASLSQLRSGLDKVREENKASLDQVRSENSSSLERIRTQNAEGLGKVQAGLDKVRSENTASLEKIRIDNNANLAQMRDVVDQRLQKTLNARIAESFKVVSDQLDSVSRGLGEMRGMAQNVGDLKRVLSNVKTRGIVGEVQLGAILQEILTPEQFETNVVTVPGSANRVEFAVKIPGKEGEYAYLPIDSKFPAETYEHLQDAQTTGDAAAIEAAWRALETRLKGEAKDIHDKYLAPPATTTFGILFLPFEGLYAEVVNRAGLLESLQSRWHVNVAGPSTMAALLNALQMGFQTVAIQKRADEIQKVLQAVKAELPKYKSELEKAQRQLNTASKTIDNLIGRRTKAMERKLRGVTSLDSLAEADKLLGVADPDLDYEDE